MGYWFIIEMRLLWQYSYGWAFHYGVPGRRWLIIPMTIQAIVFAVAWLLVSPIVRYPKPPVFKHWFIGRCHAYMRGAPYEHIRTGLWTKRKHT